MVTSDIQTASVSDNKPSYSSQGKTGSRGMKLTPKSRNVETFVDSIRSVFENVPILCFIPFLLRKEGGHVATLSSRDTRTAVSQPSASLKYSAPVHILVQEKISLMADRNGGLEQFEVDNNK